MRYLLDTNILSSMLRVPGGIAHERMRGLAGGSVFTSIVVAAELRFGAAKKGSQTLLQGIEALLRSIAVEPLSTPSDASYASIRVGLERAGTPIGNNDMLIAAHALATDSILVTDNTREFSRIPGLKIENWLREQPAQAEV
jgi:tRNA(fMet)-specific endonuclease VapC